MSSSAAERGSLAAVLAVAEGLDPMVSVQRAIDAAMELTGARYGAIGLFGPDGQVSEFIYRGITDEQRAAIGPLPTGKGVLGTLARSNGPMRLARVSDHPEAVGYPAHHPPMTTLLGAPIRVEGVIFGTIYLTDKADGLEFTQTDQDVVEALAAAVAVAVRNSRSYERTRQRERWQRAATAIDYAVLSGSSPVEVLQIVAAEVRRLAGADVAVVGLPDETGRVIIQIVDVRNSRSLGEARWSVDRSRRPDGPREAHLESVLQWHGLRCDGQCLLMDAFTSGQTMLAPGPQGAPTGAPAAAAFATAAAIPMRTPERSLGVLGLFWDHAVPQLTGPSMEVAQAFAAQAAVTLMLAEARQVDEDLRVFRDRDRIARDMHDLVVQRVFATGMSLQSALRSAAVPDVVRERVERAITDLDETLTEIRRTIFDLHTTDAEPPKVRTRLQREALQAAVLLGFTPGFSVTGPIDALPAPLADHLLAALREGLSNAARHSHASKVTIEARMTDREICLTVADDGVGPPATLTRQSGLANLAARAGELGGVSKLVRAPAGTGSQLVWRVPLG